jgi:hypothetical protein
MKTRKVYYKNGKEVVRPRSIGHNGNTYLNPSDELLVSLGFEIKEIEVPEPTPYVPTYEQRVVQLIREKYSMDDELALQRQRDSKPEEFAEYNRFVEECKVLAR